MITEFFTTLWTMTCEMAPYLLLGFFIAGVLHAFLPKSFYRHHLTNPTIVSVFKAALFGIPLPLCSCGVIPTAMSLRNEGASKGATVSFLIATPQTGVDSIAATYSMLGLPFAIMRPVVALVTAMFGGIIANKYDDSDDAQGSTCTRIKTDDISGTNILNRIYLTLKYGFYDMIQDLGRWLIIGLVIATFITMFVPNDFFASFTQYPLLSMILVLSISVPMYLCATGSIPIALALMLKGLSPGAALVLLMAGPATNVASILMIYKVLGRKTTAIYLTAIIVGSMAFGLAIDYLLPIEWFSIKNIAPSVCCASHNIQPWINVASAVFLCVMLIICTITRYIHPHKTNTIEKNNNMKRYKIEGMMCNHCKSNVEKNLKALPGVDDLKVDLSTGIAEIEGHATASAIIKKVTELGYTCTEIVE